MKSKIQIFLPLFLCCFCLNLAFAQRGMRGTPEERAEKQTQELVKQLALSEAQAAKIKTVQLDMAQKMQVAFEQADGDREARRAAMKKIRTTHRSEIKKYLTAEQFQAWEKIQEERRSKRQGRRRSGPPAGNS